MVSAARSLVKTSAEVENGRIARQSHCQKEEAWNGFGWSMSLWTPQGENGRTFEKECGEVENRIVGRKGVTGNNHKRLLTTRRS